MILNNIAGKYDLYCGQLEAENERLKAKLARYEMFETATQVWGY